jgi:hypothetical protein
VYSGFYELQSEQIELEAWKYQFYSFAGEDKDYLWNINGQEYTQNFPLIEIEPEVDLEVSLEISEAQIQCSDELSSTHEWTQSDDYVNYYYQPFEWEHVNGTGGVHFHFTEAGSDVTEINWIVDENGQLVTGQGLTLSHNFQTNGPHKVIINVVLSDGYTFRYAENIPAFESVETCAANFHFEPVPLQFEVAKVRIDYTDESGTRFSSLPDPGYEANGFFEIVSVNEFYNEQQASFTRKIEVVLSCTLFEIGNGDNTLLLEGFSGVMAVSFPQ